MVRIGFVGFGEVASVFSRIWLDGGGAVVLAYDHKLAEPEGLARLHALGPHEQLQFTTLDALLDNVDVVFSTVTSSSAMKVAQLCAPRLRCKQVFVDMNSMSPDAKRTICEAIHKGSGDFVEAAILSTVRNFGARARVLLCGPQASDIVQLMRVGGFTGVEVVGPPIGRASTFKLLRSVFSKGLEAVLLETLLAAELYDIREEIWAELLATFSAQTFESLATTWITTHPVAYERRLTELSEVCRAVEHTGLTPHVTVGVMALFEQSARLAFQNTQGRVWTVPEVVKTMVGELTKGTPLRPVEQRCEIDGGGP